MPNLIQYVCVLLCGAGSWDLFKQGVLHFCQDFLAAPKVKPIRAWDNYRAEVQGIALTQHFWYFLWRGLECFYRTATYPAYVSAATCSSGARIFAVLFLCFRTPPNNWQCICVSSMTSAMFARRAGTKPSYFSLRDDPPLAVCCSCHPTLTHTPTPPPKPTSQPHEDITTKRRTPSTTRGSLLFAQIHQAAPCVACPL